MERLWEQFVQDRCQYHNDKEMVAAAFRNGSCDRVRSRLAALFEQGCVSHLG